MPQQDPVSTDPNFGFDAPPAQGLASRDPNFGMDAPPAQTPPGINPALPTTTTAIPKTFKTPKPPTTPAQKKRDVRVHPGESIYRQYAAQQSKQKVQDVGAAMLPPVTAAIGETFGPPGAAIGAGIGTQGERLFGKKPTAAETAENMLLYGGTSAAFKGVSTYAPKLARWIGLAGPKAASPEAWAAANDALGIGKGEISLPLGAKGPEAAYVNPGRTVLEKTGITPQELSRMNPFQQAARITPAWTSSGQEVANIADMATKNGITYDAMKSLTKAIGDLPSPETQDFVTKKLTGKAQELGVADWRKATPEQGRELLQMLWHDLPRSYHGLPVRDLMYRAARTDLVSAVPQLSDAMSTYSGLTRALEATQEASSAAMAKTAPSGLAQAWQSIPAPVRSGVEWGAGAVGVEEILRRLLRGGGS